jgi:protein-L-isoaspartate(D-aspartate) O-methyltransferase
MNLSLPHRVIQLKLIAFLAIFLLALPAWAGDNILRLKMIETINKLARDTQNETGRAVFDKRVMAAMAKVPRHEFVPRDQIHFAYTNHPLSIGQGQTISQPYIVALMTDLLDVKADDVVLEIGTGSGYQAAVLAELVKEVYTIEIIEELGKQSQERLAKLGYNNVEVKIGDGYYGWEEHAPFQGIIVTAGANQIPPLLIKQLKPGGRMIIPVGEHFYIQYLTLVEKDDQGEITTRNILPVAFVPFTGGH